MKLSDIIALNTVNGITSGGPGSGRHKEGGGEEKKGLKMPPKGMHNKYSNDVGTVFEHDQQTGTYRTKSGAEYSTDKMRRLVKEGAYSKHDED